MLTLGVDLASQPKKSAACLIDWTANGASVSSLELGLTDDDILTLAGRADLVAIDAPFGWPQPFVKFVNDSEPAHDAMVWDAGHRDSLCFRRTDLHVRGLLGRPPLSVSSDKIAITAMRCAGLLRRLGVTDRSGVDGVVEVYPAVALHVWGFASMRYKVQRTVSQHHHGNLATLVGELLSECSWLQLNERHRQLCATNDDAFDALVASLAGRAAALGLTVPPSSGDAELAKTEGWIAVPQAGTLNHLSRTSLRPTRPSVEH